MYELGGSLLLIAAKEQNSGLISPRGDALYSPFAARSIKG